MLFLQDGRPRTKEFRLEKELRTYDFLDALKIPYQRVDHEPVMTIADCEQIDRVLADAVICKNLFLCDATKTEFYLLLIVGNKRFHTKEISQQIGCKRLSFAPESYMEQYLDITPGSASILGLINDTEHKVSVLVDRDVFQGEYFGCHPCVNTTSLRLKTSDVFNTFLTAVQHPYTIVTCGE